MVEPHADTSPESVGDHSRDNEGGLSRGSRLILWAVASLTFLVYLAFGSVEARIWRFNRLSFEDRRISEVWMYLGDNLPPMPAQPLVTTLYYISVAVMVIGTVYGLWLFLAEEDPVPSQTTSSGSSSSADNV